MVSLGAWHAITLNGMTPHITDAAAIDALAGQEESVEYAMTVIGAYLGSAFESLQAVTPDDGVGQYAGAMIANMLQRGVQNRHRELIERAVKAWPAQTPAIDG